MKILSSMFLVIISFFFACNQQITNPELENNSDVTKGLMKLSLDMTSAPPEVVRLEGRLHNDDGGLIYFDFEIDENSATATVENIASGIWTLTVDAFDVDDDMIYTGTIVVTVYPGIVTPVSIHLNPATGSLEITVTWGDGNEDDQFEDNDQQSDAAPLIEYTYYHNLYVSTLDDDWYSMAISADSLSITCDFIHSNGDINIDLVDDSGMILASSQSNTDNEKIDHIVNQLGVYYIHVYLSSGRSNTYTIWWDDIWSGGR